MFSGCGVAAYVCGDGNRWVGWSWESRDAHAAAPGDTQETGHCLALSGLEKIQLLEAPATVPRTLTFGTLSTTPKRTGQGQGPSLTAGHADQLREGRLEAVVILGLM